jgi:hypothetical protein
MALAKRTISRASYDAILSGTLSLQQAKAIGRDGAPAADTGRYQSGPGMATEISRSASAQDDAHTPPQPTSRISKHDTTQECWCGCQELTSPNRRWKPGHDQRAKGIIRRAVKEGKTSELSPQLKEYGKERGLI